MRHPTSRLKNRKAGYHAMEYPAVLGSPVAGIVEAFGADVTKVAVGDRIVCGTKVFVAKKAKYGGLQRFSVVDESEVVEVSICIAVHRIYLMRCRLAMSSLPKLSHLPPTLHRELFSAC